MDVRFVSCAILALVMGCSASEGVGAQRAPNLFGPDDRMEWYAHPDPLFQDISRLSVGAIVPHTRIDAADPEDVQLISRGTHTEVHTLCPGETFGEQPVIARCSGTLIAPNLVLTAGHCFDGPDDCSENAFVTGFYYESAGVFPQLTADDVYACSSVPVVVNAMGNDYAVIVLDRPVEAPRRPVAVTYMIPPLVYDDPVVLAGFGAGLPLKIDSGGRVVDNLATFFETTADTFAGSSGAGVFLPDGRIAGIHVRGPEDYLDMGGCNAVNQLDDSPTRTNGGDASYVALALRDLCAGPTTSVLCGEDGGLCRSVCDCPADSICLTEGDSIYCAPRCGADTDCSPGHECIASRCRPGPGCFAGSLWERDVCGRPTAPLTDCGPTEVCRTYSCEPAADGDVCGNVMDIPARTTRLNVDLRTDYRDSTRGSCGGFGQDRVWAFDLTEETPFRAAPRDDGWRLYLRTDCADRTSEIACSGDMGVAEIVETLAPGRYYLFIDAAVFATRITTVDVEFGAPPMPMVDAGVMMGTDGGPMMMMGTDAGPEERRGGGCGCRIGPAAPVRSLGFAFLLATLVLARRRTGR